MKNYVAECSVCEEVIKSDNLVDMKWRVREHDNKHNKRLTDY